MASLLEVLLSHKVINTTQAREAAGLAEETGAFIGRILVAQGAVEEERLAEFLLTSCTVEPTQEDLVFENELVNLLPERLMRRYRIVPLGQDARGVLSLAVTGPLSIGGLDQVKRRLGFPMRLVRVDAETVDRLLEEASALDSEIQPSHEQAPTEATVAIESSTEEPAVAQTDTERDRTGPAAQYEEETATTVTTSSVAGSLDAPLDMSTEGRVAYPVSWQPEPVTEDIPDTLDAAFQALKAIIEESERRFAVLVGPAGDRDLVLRKLFTTVLRAENGRYVDMTSHYYPDDEPSEFPDALVIDGLDAVGLENEEEQRVLLRDISRAFSSRVPFIAGMGSSPADSESLPSGLKLTLGLGRHVVLQTDERFDLTAGIDRFFLRLVEETVQWSETAFPGAGLGSLLGTVRDDYRAGRKADAVAKGSASVESRISRLTNE